MKIAIIGAGMIGSAIARSLIKGRCGERVIATRRSVEKLKELEALGAEVTRDNKYAAREGDVIILAVKPRDVKAVLTEIRDEVAGKLVISLAAAVPIQFLKDLAQKARFVRAMPNIAVLVQESFTGYCVDKEITEEDKKLVETIFKTMGKYVEVEEKDMDAITGLSGSGPAYISILIEAFMYAGLKVGLSRDVALLSSAQTVLGTGKLIIETKKHSSEIKDMVVTPAGTTIEGIYEIEESGIRSAIMRAVEAATKKSRQITESIKNG